MGQQRINTLWTGGTEALPCFDKAIELNPKDSRAWTNKGDSLSRLGRYTEALQCYDKAIELDPNIALAWNKKEFHSLI